MNRPNKNAPLADRMRPERLQDVIGQEQAVGPNTFLAGAIGRDRVPSLIFWGPPGTGKTTLAHIIARETQHHFVAFSAVLGGVKEIRAIVAEARDRQRTFKQRTLLFVDEIHRFNKAQQDAFLPHVEDGTVVLVGATTENPSFEVNSALLSRVRVVRLSPLRAEGVARILKRALAVLERSAEEEAVERLAAFADGDARRALNLLEAAVDDAGDAPLTAEGVNRVRHAISGRYDRGGDQHYDVISAFIKSLRGSDPDAALYYLARMLEAGEKPRFIMRRLVIFAAEDVSNADPRGLQVAVSAMSGFELVGMPEGALLMAQATVFLATAPKSNASYAALNAARKAVKETGSLEIPMHLRNAPTGLMTQFGYGQGYRYPHDKGGYVAGVQYLPDDLAGARFYTPSANGYEARIRQWLEQVRGDDAD